MKNDDMNRVFETLKCLQRETSVDDRCDATECVDTRYLYSGQPVTEETQQQYLRARYFVHTTSGVKLPFK